MKYAPIERSYGHVATSGTTNIRADFSILERQRLCGREPPAHRYISVVQEG